MTARAGDAAAFGAPPVTQQSLQGHYAGFASRFTAYVVDAGASTGVFMLTLAAISFAVSVVTSKSPDWNTSDPWVGAAYAIWLFVYFAYSWAASGKTFGMAVLGVRVVLLDRPDAEDPPEEVGVGELPRLPEVDHLPVQREGRVGVVHDRVDVVGDEEDGHPRLRLEAVQRRVDEVLAADVDARGRLVEEEHLGAVDDRPRDQDPLHLTAGEDAEPLAEDGRVLEADGFEALAVVRAAFDGEELLHGDRDVGHLEVLRHVADLHLLAPLHRAGVRQEAEQDPEERRLARAVGPDQAVAIASAELDGDIRKQGLGPELHGNAGSDDHVRVSRNKKAGRSQLQDGSKCEAAL